METNIEQPHGYCLDSDGNVCFKFGNFNTSEKHEFPDATEQIEYVNDPSAHDCTVHWKYKEGIPPVDVALSKNKIANDGDDEVTVSMTLDGDAEESYDATLVISDGEFAEILEPNETIEERVVTEKDAGEIIEVYVTGDNILDSRTKEIEVVEA